MVIVSQSCVCKWTQGFNYESVTRSSITGDVKIEI